MAIGDDLISLKQVETGGDAGDSESIGGGEEGLENSLSFSMYMGPGEGGDWEGGEGGESIDKMLTLSDLGGVS